MFAEMHTQNTIRQTRLEQTYFSWVEMSNMCDDLFSFAFDKVGTAQSNLIWAITVFCQE